MNIYATLATGVTAVHALFILWVIAGAFLTARRTWLAAAHIACLVWGILIESVSSWRCPLTILEQRLLTAAGEASYRGAFLLHYLQSLVYPNLSDRSLITGAIVVCLANLGVYWYRFRATSRLQAHSHAS